MMWLYIFTFGGNEKSLLCNKIYSDKFVYPYVGVNAETILESIALLEKYGLTNGLFLARTSEPFSNLEEFVAINICKVNFKMKH